MIACIKVTNGLKLKIAWAYKNAVVESQMSNPDLNNQF